MILTPVRPVSAEFHGGDDWSSTGVGFDDYGRMTTQRKHKPIERKRPCPEWVFNQQQLAEIIVSCVEYRALLCRGLHAKARAGFTLQQRLKIAEATLGEREAPLLGNLDDLQARYKLAKEFGQTDAMRMLEQKIEEVDTRLIVNRKAATLYSGVVYHYFQRGADSVEVANALGMKPPWVRQVVWRLEHIAAQLGYGRKIERNSYRDKDPLQMGLKGRARWVFKSRAAGISWVEIKRKLGDTNPHNHHLRKLCSEYGHSLPKHPCKYGDEMVSKAANLRAKGWSWDQIAAKVGMPSTSVQWHVKRLQAVEAGI